jgi:hypothetical protein
MNREKRQLVHEYAEHFGCESEVGTEPLYDSLTRTTKEITPYTNCGPMLAYRKKIKYENITY